MQPSIITVDDSIDSNKLFSCAKTVKHITPDILSEVDLLKKCLISAGRVAGLAATQIGIQNCIIVCSFNRDNNIQEMINPSFNPISSSVIESWEGCLSVPLTACKKNRWQTIEIVYMNNQGKICKNILTGEKSIIFQHEYDHLLGRLITDSALLKKRFKTQEQLKQFLINKRDNHEKKS